jgi:hypothetical protein
MSAIYGNKGFDFYLRRKRSRYGPDEEFSLNFERVFDAFHYRRMDDIEAFMPYFASHISTARTIGYGLPKNEHYSNVPVNVLMRAVNEIHSANFRDSFRCIEIIMDLAPELTMSDHSFYGSPLMRVMYSEVNIPEGGIFQMMLEKKADPNTPERGPHGNMGCCFPLAAAIRASDNINTRLLLNAKADPNGRDVEHSVSAATLSSESMLSIAMQSCLDLNSFTALLYAGAEPNFCSESIDLDSGHIISMNSILFGEIARPFMQIHIRPARSQLEMRLVYMVCFGADIEGVLINQGDSGTPVFGNVADWMERVRTMGFSFKLLQWVVRSSAFIDRKMLLPELFEEQAQPSDSDSGTALSLTFPALSRKMLLRPFVSDRGHLALHPGSNVPTLESLILNMLIEPVVEQRVKEWRRDYPQ